MKNKKLTGINNYCCHSHNINKGKFVYTVKMQDNIICSLSGCQTKVSKLFEKGI